MTIFERYGELSGDARLFREASTAPLPLTAWANPPLWPAARSLLTGLAGVLEPLEWVEGAFRVSDQSDPTFMQARLLGALHIQEEAALMPVIMLAPQDDERILDACAAPGNKTAAIAVRLASGGRVIAVDINEARMGVLRTTLNTLGIANAAGVRADAAGLPEVFGAFDAAMIDVPCSCEGTSRKHPDVIRCTSEEARRSLVRLQTDILRSAIRRIRPGGRIVYATCTYAPEENEGVVADVVERPEQGQEVAIRPGSIDGLDVVPGLTWWKGRSFPPEMAHAKRLWPHRSNTGGFFAVLLEKVGDGAAAATCAEEDARPDIRPVDATAGPWSVFGFDPAMTERIADMHTGSKYSSIITRSLIGDPVLRLPRKRSGHTDPSDASGPALLFAGMRGLNLKSRIPRPSTAMAVRFGAHASRGTVDIRKEDVRPWMRRNNVPVQRRSEPARPVGVSIVRSEGCSLGLGRIESDAPDTVRSLFPKVRAGIDVAETLPADRPPPSAGGSGK